MSQAAGSRLPAATRVGRVRLAVADLERSVGFYQRVLGLRVLDDLDSADGRADRLSLGPAGSAEALVVLREEPGAAPVPRRGRLGLFHFAILLPDRPALGRFLQHLGELGVRPGASDHRVSEALYLNDPDGLGIEVYADRPRSEWRERDGELMMATEPLDLQSVLAAADDAATAAEGHAWDGMPEGTTMGHVHLHVGDLERASAFFHEALGLDPTVWSYPGALFLSAGGYHHHLGVNTWAAGAAPAGEGDARLLEWELIVPTAGDAEAALGRLEAAGHTVERNVEQDDAARGSGGLVRDPWGTALRVRSI